MFLYFTLLLDLGTVLSTIALKLQEKYCQAFSGVMSFHYIYLTSQFPLREISCSHIVTRVESIARSFVATCYFNIYIKIKSQTYMVTITQWR